MSPSVLFPGNVYEEKKMRTLNYLVSYLCVHVENDYVARYINIYIFICSKARSGGTREAEDSNKYIALSSWPIFGRINCQNTVNHTDELRCRCEKRKILLRNEKLRV